MKNSFFILLLFIPMALMPGLGAGADKRYVVPLEGSPSIGPADARLTIVEFLDYQ